MKKISLAKSIRGSLMIMTLYSDGDIRETIVFEPKQVLSLKKYLKENFE